MCLIRSELGFLGELDDAFLVPLAGIPFAHGPSIPSPLPRGVLVFVIRAFVRRAFPSFQGNRCQNLHLAFVVLRVNFLICAGQIRLWRRGRHCRFSAGHGGACEDWRLFES